MTERRDRTKWNEYRKSRYWLRKAAGECTRCGKELSKAREGLAFCVGCAAYHRLKTDEWRRKAKDKYRAIQAANYRKRKELKKLAASIKKEVGNEQRD